MHPILEDRRRLALYLLAWLLVGLLLTLGLRSDSPWLTAAAFLLPLCFVYAFFGLSAWYLCRAFPIDAASRLSTLIIVQMTAAACASAIWVGLAYIWAGALDALIPGLFAQAFFAEQRPLLFVVGTLLFWLAAAAHYLLIAFQASRDAEVRAIELTLLAREAELRALRAQIDPHFIFNSLHSISALTATDAAAARRMCLLLADFLRETLRLGVEQPHSVRRRAGAGRTLPRHRAGAARVASAGHARNRPARRRLPGAAAAAAAAGRERGRPWRRRSWSKAARSGWRRRARDRR